MYPADHYLNRQIQLTLYMLKRQYGGLVDIYKLESSSTDVRTGVKTIVKTVTTINRAVVLPCTIKRVATQGISLISANKQLVEGGTYDQGARDFIIDRRDCPDLPTLTQDDWLVYNDTKFQIKEVQEFEFGAGWVITTSEIVGERPEQIFVMTAEAFLDFEASLETE